MTAREEADRLYPPDRIVPDPDGETGEAHTDPYGYDEACNDAFLKGASWMSQHFAALIINELRERYILNKSGPPYVLHFNQQEIEQTIRDAAQGVWERSQ